MLITLFIKTWSIAKTLHKHYTRSCFIFPYPDLKMIHEVMHERRKILFLVHDLLDTTWCVRYFIVNKSGEKNPLYIEL